MELHIRCLPQSKHPTSESESGSVVSDCDPMDDTVHNTGVGSLSPSPGDIPNPGMEPRSPTLQVILYQLSHQGSPWLPTAPVKALMGWETGPKGAPGNLVVLGILRSPVDLGGRVTPNN